MIDFIKAKISLILIGSIWGSFIVIMLPLLIIAVLYDAWVGTHTPRGWVYSILLAQDHMTNAVLGGHFLTTISAMLGHLKLKGSVTGGLVASVVDWGFEVGTGEINHCVNAMQGDDVYNFSSSRALLGASVYFSGVYALGVMLCN